MGGARALWLCWRDLSFKHGSVEQVEEDIHRDACDLMFPWLPHGHYHRREPRIYHPRGIDIHRSDMNVRYEQKSISNG